MVVDVRERLQDLGHDVVDEAQRHFVPVLDDVVEEFAALEILHHDEYIARVNVVFVDFDHIDMVDFGQEVDFAADFGDRVHCD